ncbi:ML domain-containing protein [Aspergillus leporis]|uniref:Phosphatidylglycerol/phosphatidylinositol transfer protein n=1 Tax=Aspergillus leporis TaxID=41062 RepID=A0A5N5WMT8_9EURO|nr:ML domain-containing protein [Aspergillus leporis]
MYFSFPFFALLTSSIAFQFPITSPHFHVSNAWGYTNCGKWDDVVQLKDISVNPDPPSAGKSLEVKLAGTVTDVIDEGAYIDVTIRLGRVKILTKTFDVCKTLSDYNSTIQCPVKPGTFEVSHTADLPRELPLARFDIDALGFTNTDEDMLCLKIIADFRRQLK